MHRRTARRHPTSHGRHLWPHCRRAARHRLLCARRLCGDPQGEPAAAACFLLVAGTAAAHARPSVFGLALQSPWGWHPCANRCSGVPGSREGLPTSQRSGHCTPSANVFLATTALCCRRRSTTCCAPVEARIPQCTSARCGPLCCLLHWVAGGRCGWAKTGSSFGAALHICFLAVSSLCITNLS